MLAKPSSSRFFGFDLQLLWADLCASWAAVYQWRALGWLTPAVHIKLVHENGRHSLWFSGAASAREVSNTASASFLAVELPEDRILRRIVTLPLMSGAGIADAIALEVRTTSPFTAEDTVWGYLAKQQRNTLQVELVQASRKQTEQYLQQVAEKNEMQDAAEVWALSASREPIVIVGFAEARRASAIAVWRRAGLWLFLITLILLTAIAITPTAQLRMRALEADSLFSALTLRVAPLTRKRESLVKSSDGMAALNEIISTRVDPLAVMNLLTQALPDNTVLSSLRIQGITVFFSGQTDNTAVLMASLGHYPGLRDVKAPSAATKPLGSNKEIFSIELTLDPKTMNTIVAPSQPYSPSAPSAPSPPSSPATGQMSIDMPATVAPASVATAEKRPDKPQAAAALSSIFSNQPAAPPARAPVFSPPSADTAVKPTK